MSEEEGLVGQGATPSEVVLPPLPSASGPTSLPPEMPDQRALEEATFQRPRTLKDLQPGMVLEGRVTSVAVYGAFVDIGVGREGLVHLSQLSDRPVTSPTEVVQIGDMVTVRVLEVDPRSKRISLTMREHTEAELDAERLEALAPGSVVEGTVTSLTKFGAFVDLGVGKDGLVPLAQMQKAEMPQVGDRVRVRVMDVDRKSGRIRLSMRNVPDTSRLASLQPGDIVRGRITSLAPFGAFVDLGVGKDGLIHVSAMGDGTARHPREVVQVGQEVEVRVVEVNPQTQRISLSMQLEEEEEEEMAWTPAVEEEAEFTGEATLEDLAARFNAMRAGGRAEMPRRTSRAEKEKRAVQDALRRTLEGVKGD